MDSSLTTLRAMCDQLGVRMTILRKRSILHSALTVVEVLVRKIADSNKIEVRCAVLGTAQCGKSSLIGVLSHGMLDNGSGGARAGVLRHIHELETGLTSSISTRVVAFDSEGKVLHASPLCDSVEHVIEKAAKVVNLVDLCGHDKYFKTTVAGLTGQMPDYAAIVISVERGLDPTTAQHEALARALKLRCFYVLSKVDRGGGTVEDTARQLQESLVLPGERDVPLRVRTRDDASHCARALGAGQLVAPIFEVSCVTGDGVELLQTFLNLLPSPLHWDSRAQEPAVFAIDNVFHSAQGGGDLFELSSSPADGPRPSASPGHPDSRPRVSGSVGSDFIIGGPTLADGFIVTGTLVQGVITLSDDAPREPVGGYPSTSIGRSTHLLIGPDVNRVFWPVCIQGIHYKQLAVERVVAGHSASFHIYPPSGFVPRRGMVVVSRDKKPRVCNVFVAVRTHMRGAHVARVLPHGQPSTPRRQSSFCRCRAISPSVRSSSCTVSP